MFHSARCTVHRVRHGIGIIRQLAWPPCAARDRTREIHNTVGPPVQRVWFPCVVCGTRCTLRHTQRMRGLQNTVDLKVSYLNVEARVRLWGRFRIQITF